MSYKNYSAEFKEKSLSRALSSDSLHSSNSKRIATTSVRSHHCQMIGQKGLKGQNFDVEKRIEQAVEEKLEEVRGACRILGFDDVPDLGFEDDDILLTQEKIDTIADMIRQVKRDILLRTIRMKVEV